MPKSDRLQICPLCHSTIQWPQGEPGAKGICDACGETIDIEFQELDRRDRYPGYNDVVLQHDGLHIRRAGLNGFVGQGMDAFRKDWITLLTGIGLPVTLYSVATHFGLGLLIPVLTSGNLLYALLFMIGILLTPPITIWLLNTSASMALESVRSQSKVPIRLGSGIRRLLTCGVPMTMIGCVVGGLLAIAIITAVAIIAIRPDAEPETVTFVMTICSALWLPVPLAALFFFWPLPYLAADDRVKIFATFGQCIGIVRRNLSVTMALVVAVTILHMVAGLTVFLLMPIIGPAMFLVYALGYDRMTAPNSTSRT
ncbi:MAG: hypothetical protein AAFP90_19300 [Planctomycetota bacterium]